MYSSKKNILETVALLKAYGINQVVLSPGTRNAPLIHTFTQHPYFTTHLVLDERNAAFFALGIIQKSKQPVAICCTSGTALLNYGPAVAEAFYQNLPLVVISADRAMEWIGQMDGQTIPQSNVFASISKKSVQIPEINSETECWYANRLLNEALIACTSGLQGPVHINIPLSEPLLDFSVTELPEVRKINSFRAERAVSSPSLDEIFKKSQRIMIVVGQQFASAEVDTVLETLAKEKNCVVLTEHLSNLHSSTYITNFDAVLATQNRDNLVPDLLITFGGHIVSKRLKNFLRKHSPKSHWHISSENKIIDLFQSLTDLIVTDVLSFLIQLSNIKSEVDATSFSNTWQNVSAKVLPPSSDMPFCDITVTGKFLERLPSHVALHLGNSSAVRNAQLFEIDYSVSIFCNRGTNGIDSPLPTVIGYASVADEMTYLILGDLSFFYTVGALWNLQKLNNLRILLINNGGGSIFHLLPGMDKSQALPKYIGAEHHTNAELWARAGGLTYLSAKNERDLEYALSQFNSPESDGPMLLEVFTDIEMNKRANAMYFSHR